MSADIATQVLPSTPSDLSPRTTTTHPSPVPSESVPRRLTDLRSRKALRSGASWGLVFGIYVASQVQAYVSAYKTQAERNALAKSFTSSGGLNALVGPAHQLNTVAGYTEWKSVGILTVLGAVWALLLSTKLLRGEEDAGRWELLLAGQTTRRGAATQAMSGLAGGLLALFVITAALTMGIGHIPSAHFTNRFLRPFSPYGYCRRRHVHGRRSACESVGGKPSSGSRVWRRHSGLFFALRMLSDSNLSLTWLHWATPLGWIEQLQPFTHPRPELLALIFGLTGDHGGRRGLPRRSEGSGRQHTA